jgi:kinesin family protein 7
MKTCIRLRPVPPGVKSVASSSDRRGLTIQLPGGAKLSEFFFDKVLGAEASDATTQVECFREVALPLVEHVLQGYNATCFAYGQTGR